MLDRLTNTRREDDSTGPLSLHLQDMHAGVTVAWLGRVFNMDPTTVKKRLAECPVLHRRKAGFVYDLAQAAPYLIKPIFDIDKALQNLRPSEIPRHLQKDFWDAKLKQQQYEERAGDLWRTHDVLEVFGEIFKLIKFTTQLWADNLDQMTGLTEPQRKFITQQVDGLHAELHKRLVELPKTRKTPSSLIEDDERIRQREVDDLV